MYWLRRLFGRTRVQYDNILKAKVVDVANGKEFIVHLNPSAEKYNQCQREQAPDFKKCQKCQERFSCWTEVKPIHMTTEEVIELAMRTFRNPKGGSVKIDIEL